MVKYGFTSSFGFISVNVFSLVPHMFVLVLLWTSEVSLFGASYTGMVMLSAPSKVPSLLASSRTTPTSKKYAVICNQRGRNNRVLVDLCYLQRSGDDEVGSHLAHGLKYDLECGLHNEYGAPAQVVEPKHAHNLRQIDDAVCHPHGERERRRLGREFCEERRTSRQGAKRRLNTLQARSLLLVRRVSVLPLRKLLLLSPCFKYAPHPRRRELPMRDRRKKRKP